MITCYIGANIFIACLLFECLRHSRYTEDMRIFKGNFEIPQSNIHGNLGKYISLKDEFKISGI